MTIFLEVYSCFFLYTRYIHYTVTLRYAGKEVITVICYSFSSLGLDLFYDFVGHLGALAPSGPVPSKVIDWTIKTNAQLQFQFVSNTCEQGLKDKPIDVTKVNQSFVKYERK